MLHRKSQFSFKVKICKNKSKIINLNINNDMQCENIATKYSMLQSY